jgi:predicted nucleic acid-binding protein
MLAATALECGAAVVTLNARRFAGFPGLTVLKL